MLTFPLKWTESHCCLNLDFAKNDDLVLLFKIQSTIFLDNIGLGTFGLGLDNHTSVLTICCDFLLKCASLKVGVVLVPVSL